MERNGPEYLCFDLFSGFPELVHAVFTRRGGVSPPPFDSLNLGLSTGDHRSAVLENRRRVVACLGLERAVFLSQVHGRDVLVLAKGRADTGLFWTPGSPLPAVPATADGVVTDIKNLGLVIQVADCQAVLLYDPEKKVIANVHSGWRGSIRNIIGNCVDTMVKRFGCRPEIIRAGISPSLGPCCAEFVNFREEIPGRFRKYKNEQNPLFDFWSVSKDQLMEKGVIGEHIANMNLCTKCGTDRFFSYREAHRTGRFAAVIGLK